MVQLLELGLPITSPRARTPNTASRSTCSPVGHGSVSDGRHRPRLRARHDRRRTRPTTPTARPCGSASVRPTERCSATCATRSATTTGWCWSRRLGPTGRSHVPRALRRRTPGLRRRAVEPLRQRSDVAPGGSAGWHESYVSSYATMHPWEDWAETFAHYLHIRDTLQTAASYGMAVSGPPVPRSDAGSMSAAPGRPPREGPVRGHGRTSGCRSPTPSTR